MKSLQEEMKGDEYSILFVIVSSHGSQDFRGRQVFYDEQNQSHFVKRFGKNVPQK